MKHPEATPWCIDAEEIISAAEYISIKNKKILNNIQHIDSQINENDIRVQGIISIEDFIDLLLDVRKFNGTLKARGLKELIVEMHFNKKSYSKK